MTRWPFIRQILSGSDGAGVEAMRPRETHVKYRRPYSTKWEELDLETAMDVIADRVRETRERTFVEKRDGEVLMHTTAMAHLGGATLDNEENYLIKKLFAAGLGMVYQLGMSIHVRVPHLLYGEVRKFRIRDDAVGRGTHDSAQHSDLT